MKSFQLATAKCLSVLLLAYLFTFSTVLFAANFSGGIADIKGTVTILKQGQTDWTPAVSGMPIQLNDRLKTGENSSCNLELDDGSIIFIGENTETSVDALEITTDKHTSKLSLWLGKIIANISKFKNTKMEVHSPTAVASVRGTEFAVEASSQNTSVGVFDGEVAVKNSTGSTVGEVTVSSNEETSVEGSNHPRPVERLMVMKKYLERNQMLRDRVGKLREELKRTPPAQREAVRLAALARFNQLREQRQEQRKNIQQSREEIKKNRFKEGTQQP